MCYTLTRSLALQSRNQFYPAGHETTCTQSLVAVCTPFSAHALKKKLSLVPSPPPQLLSLEVRILRIIRTASDDSCCGGGLGTRLDPTLS